MSVDGGAGLVNVKVKVFFFYFDVVVVLTGFEFILVFFLLVVFIGVF